MIKIIWTSDNVDSSKFRFAQHMLKFVEIEYVIFPLKLNQSFEITEYIKIKKLEPTFNAIFQINVF